MEQVVTFGSELSIFPVSEIIKGFNSFFWLMPKLVFHMILGVVVFLVVWLCGVGLLAMTPFPLVQDKGHRWMFVYPAGVVAVYYPLNLCFRGFYFLCFGAAVLLVILIYGIRTVHVKLGWRSLHIPNWGIWCPLALAAVLYIGLFITGPTPFKAGLLLHDPGFFAIRATGLSFFGAELSHLGIEGASIDYSYRTYLAILLAASFYHIPGFDPYLFLSISILVIYLLSFVYLAKFFFQERQSYAGEDNMIVLGIGFLWTISLLCGGLSPVVESSGLMLTYPVAFAIVGLVMTSKASFHEKTLMGFIALGAVLPGKFVMLGVVMPTLCFSLLKSFFEGNKQPRQKFIFAVIIFVVGGISLLSTLYFVTLYQNVLPEEVFQHLKALLSLAVFPEPFGFIYLPLYLAYLSGLLMLLFLLLKRRCYVLLFGVLPGLVFSVCYEWVGLPCAQMSIGAIALSLAYKGRLNLIDSNLLLMTMLFMTPLAVYRGQLAVAGNVFLEIAAMGILLGFHLAVLRSVIQDDK